MKQVAQDLAPKLIHEAFCEPIRRKPPLVVHRQETREYILNHRRISEKNYNKDIIEFCRGKLFMGEGNEPLSRFPSMREFHQCRTDGQKVFPIWPLVSTQMK